MTAAADFSSSALSALLRALGLVLLAVGAAFAFLFAAAAALVVAAMVVGAGLALRFWPRREGAEGVLEARRTPAGWIVESATKREA